MGTRRTVTDIAFGGNNNIWSNVIYGTGTGTLAATTAAVGSFYVNGTGANPTIWHKSSTANVAVISVSGAGGTWTKISY